MMTILEVNGKLKQRPPFQFVDRIIEYTPKEYAKGIKNVTVNEPYFSGHFPDAPVMPGVLLIECCEQMCAVCLDLGENEDPTKINVMLKADGFRFMKAVIPGDTLVITVNKTRSGGPLSVFDAVITVDGEVYVKGTLTFAVADKKAVYERKG